MSVSQPYLIDEIAPDEYPEVVEVWEASVRATHHFLKEEDIAYFKPLILRDYLKAVDLRCVRGETGRILGFLGVADANIEMLFVHPGAMGTGVGKILMRYALDHFHTTKVDVNEDNPNARAFYEHFGFQVVRRSPLDGLGKPYPILHMSL